MHRVSKQHRPLVAAGPVVMPAWQVPSRPRSPNPTHMPADLNKPPALQPGLSQHAKNWVEIAVSQRGSPGGVNGADRLVSCSCSLLH